MINLRCRYFRAYKPCIFNKIDGSECPTCTHSSEFAERILFIKLDAIGDVLRSASFIPIIAARHKAPYIVWVTRRDSAELVSMIKHVDEVIDVDQPSLARIAAGGWDYVYSLSNDWQSASLAAIAQAKHQPIGFWLENGIIQASNAAAERWLEMAAFDRVKRQNTETYQRRMLDILEFDGRFEPPALEIQSSLRAAAVDRIMALFPDPKRPRVAINVGAGSRWPKKMLQGERICEYIHALFKRYDVDVMLVGGEAETNKADAIRATFADDTRIQLALTPASVPDFIAILLQANVLLCGDTLALHIASAIGLPAVAVFGPTSFSEIADFDGLIAKIATPLLDCLGCYGDCRKEANCMTLLDVDHLVDVTFQQLNLSMRTRR